MEVGAELLIFLADFRELGGDYIHPGGDSYYATDGGAEDGEDRAFAGRDGVESMGGAVLYKVGVELEAIPGFPENFCQEGEMGGGAWRGGR